MNTELKEKLLSIGDKYLNKFNHTPNTYTLDKCYNIFNEYVDELIKSVEEDTSLKIKQRGRESQWGLESMGT